MAKVTTIIDIGSNSMRMVVLEKKVVDMLLTL